MLSLDGWSATWRALGVSRIAEAQPLHGQLVAAWSEPHRHYHTLQHLQECFERLTEIRSLAERPAEVELALWFHDAIYQPRKSDNEARSAEWARRCAVQLGVPSESADRVAALVMATRHAAAPVTADEQVLVDVDLSILAASPVRFAEYEEQVRAEYRWVPGFLYKRGRRKILQEFLARPRIYSTAPFLERYEAAARANLRRSVGE